LLNSTFALIPGGRSPGTYRLTETLMAGSIPVFVDQFDDRSYVRPLDGIVPWELMSIRISASMIHTLMPSLLRWSREDVVAARRKGTEATETFLLQYESWALKIYMNRLFFGTSL
jgi:glucuronyl/N-acetylglucosaminyl transferase EXT1